MPQVVPFIPLIAAGVGLISANKSRKQSREFMDEQNDVNTLALEEQKEAKEDFNERIEKYEKTEFVPLDTEALKQENIFEDADLTRDVIPAADYAKEQFQQQQANIMQGLRGVAGASGVAGLAQALSGQAKDQSRQTSLTIGKALSDSRKMALTAEQSKRDQERNVLLSNMQGANAFELDKMATLMGVSGQSAYAANMNAAQSRSNQVQMQSQMMANQASYTNSFLQLASNYGGGGGWNNYTQADKG